MNGSETTEEPIHPILPCAWKYEIIGIRLEREPFDGSEPYLDLRLRNGTDRRLLRFWSPRELEIECGGPRMTGGLVIRDVRARGLDGIGVMVDDVEASPGSVTFYARTVEAISEEAG
jgi:hypothetical protein